MQVGKFIPLFKATHVSSLTSVAISRKPAEEGVGGTNATKKMESIPNGLVCTGIHLTTLSFCCGPSLRPALEQAILCMELVENKF